MKRKVEASSSKGWVVFKKRKIKDENGGNWLRIGDIF